MKTTRRRLLVTITAVVVLVILFALFPGCGTTRKYRMPYAKVEGLLFEHLHLDKDLTLRNPRSVQARAEGDLVRPMSMKLFAVDLHQSTPGQALSFTCHHLYDIGAVGGQYILFDLQRVDEGSTRVTVDYCDRWYGMWPPFVFWNPGPVRERNIHKAIWGKESTNHTSEGIRQPADGLPKPST